MNNKKGFMKNMKYNFLFGIVLVCAMLFATCDDNSNEYPEIFMPVDTPIESGYGRIGINVIPDEDVEELLQEQEMLEQELQQNQQARTIMPTPAFSRYVYTFTKADETGVIKEPDNSGLFTLEIGNYTVTVQAYIGTTEPYTLVAGGTSSQFSVGSGSNSTVEVPLSAIDTGDTIVQGTFSYTITYPAGAEATITLMGWTEKNIITLNPVNVSSGNGKTQTLQLNPDSYLFTVLISKTGLYAGISESIHINPSLTTEYTKNYEESDLLALRVPLSTDYDITGTGTFIYSSGTARSVTVTPKANVSPSTPIVYYEGTGATTYARSTIAPEDVGTYVVTFDVAEAAGWSAATGLPAGDITIEAQTFSISLNDASSNPLTSYTFPTAAPGYSAQTARNITVRNTGNQVTGDLTVALSGTNASSFQVAQTTSYGTTATLTSIPVGNTTRTFNVRPITSLPNGTYEATVTVSGNNGISAQFSVSFTVQAIYSISLSQTTTYTFPGAALNYGTQTARTVTINNTGNMGTGALTIASSSTNFTVSPTSVTNIAANGSTTFTVRPNTGLTAGTYTATITVSGTNVTSQSFSVSFTVSAATYGITLSQTTAYTFTAAMEGYGAQTARTVTVTNSGNQATGALTVALSGTNASSFTLSTTSISSIAANGTASFTVVPKTGLAVGTHTATVTVSGGSNITARTFTVSFTVNADPSKIVFGQQYTGTISTTNTSFQYTVVLPSAGRLTVNVTNTTSFWKYIDWIDNSNTTIRTNSALYDYNDYMDLESGTYYIKIRRDGSSNGTFNLTVTFAPANNTENEPNNATNTADSIMSGETVKGLISYQDDVDIYKIVKTQPGRITLTVNNESSSWWKYIDWLDGNGSTIRTNNPLYDHNDYMDLEAGTYFIRVRKEGSITGTYFLRADYPLLNNNEIEPNNTLGTAQTITSGEQIKGLISYQDEDWYKIVLANPGRLSLVVNNGSGSWWKYIDWLDSTGTQIGTSNSLYDYNGYMDLETGTYYIRIRREGTGTYFLKADFIPAHNNEIEPNNEVSTSAAQLITSGQAVKGLISYQDSNDIYRVVLSQAGQLTVSVTNDGSSWWKYIYWYDSAGVRIRTGNSLYDYNDSMSGLAAGTYYIHICKDGTSTGAYTLKATFPSATTQIWYSVTYNANSGSGAPSAQVKQNGVSLTLSSTRPSRASYNFLGWATTSNATSATYQPGASFTLNADTTLYAVWQALPTYTIQYNANSGLGAPTAQTKTQGTPLTLSSTRPTRSGYNFLGWSTSSSSTAVEQYQPGDSYTADSAATLYAVWHTTATTYTITFNANGGSGAPASQTKTHGTALILDRTRPTRGGSTFLGWATTSNATVPQYPAGASYTVEATRTLYAVWQ